MIRYFFTDDFGNQWMFKKNDVVIVYYPAPTQKLEDALHDEWGSWK